jgi:hypothetical protein
VLQSAGQQTDLELIEHGITLEGHGQVILSDSSGNVIRGTVSDVTLTNVDNIISGAGELGDGRMILVNQGTITANGTQALEIDTGINVVLNSGTLQATGNGGLIVDSVVENSGTVLANGGNITFRGAVTGSGSAIISGSATLEFGAASTENTTFAPNATGTLKLDQSGAFTGSISGFGTGDSLDLVDVGFGNNTTLAFSENSDGSGGKLYVGDGVQTVGLTLLGQYAAAGFQVGSDSTGGALVTYVAPAPDLTESLLTKPTV